MRTSVLLLAFLVACGEAPSEPRPTAPAPVDARSGEPQPETARAVEPALECRAGALGIAVSSAEAVVEAWTEPLTLNPAAGRPGRGLAVFTAPAGALWVAAPHTIDDATPTPVRGVIAPSDPAAHPLCGTGTVTWRFGDVAGDVALDELAALPSCDEGEPIEGTLEACIDVLGRSCDGEGQQVVSTVPGHTWRTTEGEVYFGGADGGPIVFTLPHVSGAARRRGAGYALLDPDSAAPTLLCVTSVTHQPARGHSAARLVLSGLRRLGTCGEAEPIEGGHLDTCAQWR